MFDWLPWKKRARRKDEFVKKLQSPGYGTRTVRFKPTAAPPMGAIIMLSNDHTGEIVSAILLNKNEWTVYGTSKSIATMTSIELEDLLTGIRNEAPKDNQVHFMDGRRWLDYDLR